MSLLPARLAAPFVRTRHGTRPPAHEAFWRRSPEELFSRLDRGPQGLASREAASRRLRFGLNSYREHGRQHLVLRIARKLLNPLIAILLAAAAVSGLSGDLGSFIIIVTVISISLALDVIQEHHAETAVDALRRSVAVTADVRRDDTTKVIPVEDIVPGDVVELRTGDLVPADGLVLEAQNAQVNESLMTGEPFPAMKSAAPCASRSPADATNALFSGTALVGGSALMLVVHTGLRTRFGSIAAGLAASEPPTALEQGVQHLGLLILRLTVFLTLFVLRQPHRGSPSGRFLPVRRRPCRRAHPRTAADDHDGHPRPRRPAHGRTQGHRQTPVCHSRSRRHGRPVRRQDRNAD